MNLHMMRDIDGVDPIGELGPRKTPAPTPAPEPVKRPDGFIESPDGKLSTSLPPPAVPRRGSQPLQTGTAAPAPEPEPGAPEYMRKPPAGAMWRSVGTGSFYRWTPEGAELWMDDGQGWQSTHVDWELHEFEGPAFEPVRKPLKVGDKIRILPPFRDAGSVHVVTVLHALSFGTAACNNLSPFSFEGKGWERVA